MPQDVIRMFAVHRVQILIWSLGRSYRFAINEVAVLPWLNEIIPDIQLGSTLEPIIVILNHEDHRSPPFHQLIQRIRLLQIFSFLVCCYYYDKLRIAANGHGTQSYEPAAVRPYGQAAHSYVPRPLPAQRQDTYVAVPGMHHSGIIASLLTCWLITKAYSQYTPSYGAYHCTDPEVPTQHDPRQVQISVPVNPWVLTWHLRMIIAMADR